MLNIGFLLKQINRHSDIFVLERAGDAKKWNDVKKAAALSGGGLKIQIMVFHLLANPRRLLTYPNIHHSDSNEQYTLASRDTPLWQDCKIL